jgi:subtilase-type serine protease
MLNMKLTAVACAVFGLISTPAQAIDVHTVNDAKGTPFLTLLFFSTADDSSLPRDFTEDQKQQVLAGVDYWARILTITPGGNAPAVINVATSADPAAVAYAISNLATNDPFSPTVVQSILQNLGPDVPGSHGLIVVGPNSFDPMPYTPSLIGLNKNGISLPVVMVHEVAHAMGVLNVVDNSTVGSGTHTLTYGSSLSLYSAGLRDDNDQAALPGQDIWCTGCINIQSGTGVFDVRQNNGYFTGTHVNEVMAGAMKGIPVSMFHEDGRIDDNYMSHFELKNSLMSHQMYRNYTSMMEAELAVLQDIGYQIDRRDFYGSSIYGSNQTITNNNGYFQRNADGTAYIDNTYNQTTQGLGLHVYGSNNTVYQQADLLSEGAGSGGIRVDGEGNAITILPGTKVHANGAYSRGVLFTYGKGHSLVQRGDVMATGEQGIGVSFDFGRNIAGDRDQRGSYIHTVNGVDAALLPELDGALATKFDLTGSVTGRYASIYISDNAHVENINVMQGAQIYGDIISEYDEVDGNGNQRLTQLTFGLTPDADGNATNQADSAFELHFDGNITGKTNLDLQIKGGITTLNGAHSLYRATIEQGATLSGNSSYALNSQGHFTNNGTLIVGAEGNTTITGDYTQTATGSLQVGLSGDNTIHNLVVAGNATVDGALVIAPQRSWFADGTTVTSNKWIDATSLSGSFSNLTVALNSPTLTATASDLGNNTVSVTTHRVTNAYSQYASNAADRQVGEALDAISGNANNSLQSLFAALDFSTSDGSQIQSSLEQLSPASYSEMFHGGLLRERRISQLVAGAGSNDNSTNNTITGNWNTFAIPFGSYYRHAKNGDTIGASGNTYGVVFGGETKASNQWTFGVHGAVTGQSTRVGDTLDASGKSTGIDIGTHARFATNPYQGAHAFGLVRLGVDDNRFDRTVSVNGFNSKSTGKWTGVSFNTAIGGGWRIQTGEASSIGPIAGLDYTVLHRPEVTETGGDGTRLHLDKQNYTSLRAHVGAQWQSTFKTNAGNAFKTSLQAAWHHELKDTAVNQTAAFADYASNRFSSRNTVIAKDSMSVQGGLSYQIKQDVEVSANLSGTVWKGGDREFAGAVSVNWKF